MTAATPSDSVFVRCVKVGLLTYLLISIQQPGGFPGSTLTTFCLLTVTDQSLYAAINLLATMHRFFRSLQPVSRTVCRNISRLHHHCLSFLQSPRDIPLHTNRFCYLLTYRQPNTSTTLLTSYLTTASHHVHPQCTGRPR